MRKYLLGSMVAAAAVLSFSFVILPGITSQLNAAKPRAGASTPDLTGIWSPPRTSNGFLPYSFAPEAPPPMQPWAAMRCHRVRQGHIGPRGGRLHGPLYNELCPLRNSAADEPCRSVRNPPDTGTGAHVVRNG